VIQTFTCELALLEYGVASVAASDHDRHLVKTTRDGALLAVVDGAGHGRGAAGPARLAVDTLEAYANESVVDQFQRCHDRLRSTRGAVMSMAAINAAQNSLTWAGVGNIEGMILRSSPRGIVERLLLRPGIVGYRLPSLRAAILPLTPGDLILLSTDGITPDFETHIMPEEHPRIVANRISFGFRKRSEDGLVLVVRYLGNHEPS